MKYHIELNLAEELAAVLEDARSYGLQWATFRVADDQIIPENWTAHTEEIAAQENVLFAPNTVVVRINEFLPELYQFIDQTPEQMQQAINYYELKTQLQTLGFTDPLINDELRQMVAGETQLYDIYTQQENAEFTLSFQHEQHTGYQLYCIDASKDQIMQYLQPDVPVNLALELLQLPARHDHDPFRPLNLSETQQYIHELKNNTMNTENLNYLQKQLLNLGFGEKLNDDLAKKLKSNKKEFSLTTGQEYNKQTVDYTLHFKAGDDRVFFNKYDAKACDKQHTFYINKSGAITAKEAYNLLEGRAVHKELENLEGEKYKAWIIIDKEQKAENGNFKLRPFTENWNYRPERAIDKMDIVGINEEGARDKLMKSLEKGNRHQVTAMKDGKEVKLWLEANPAEHRVNLTNWKGEAQQLEHYKKPEFKQSAKQDNKQAQSQEGTKKKRSQGRKQTV